MFWLLFVSDDYDIGRSGMVVFTGALGGLVVAVWILGCGVGRLVLWAVGASNGAEWDYCGAGSGCTSGETVGLSLLVPAAIAGFVGWRMLRGNRRN